jgi:hypothetical protein
MRTISLVYVFAMLKYRGFVTGFKIARIHLQLLINFPNYSMHSLSDLCRHVAIYDFNLTLLRSIRFKRIESLVFPMNHNIARSDTLTESSLVLLLSLQCTIMILAPIDSRFCCCRNYRHFHNFYYYRLRNMVMKCSSFSR